METKKKRCCCRKNAEASVKNPAELPGVAIDKADGNKVDNSLVKERTATLDNNPRDND